jgi:hypothetical protein
MFVQIGDGGSSLEAAARLARSPIASVVMRCIVDVIAVFGVGC